MPVDKSSDGVSQGKTAWGNAELPKGAKIIGLITKMDKGWALIELETGVLVQGADGVIRRISGKQPVGRTPSTTLTISVEVAEKLEAACKKRRMTKKQAVEDAIEDWIKKK